MKTLKTFESYSEDIHKKVDIVRRAGKSKFFKTVGKFASTIDDFIRLDFKSLKHSFTNKSGFDKWIDIINEFGTLKYIMEETGDITFDDMEKYKFDEKIISYLDDEDVKEYLEHDTKFKNRMNKYEDLLNQLKEYADWKKQK